MWKTHLFFFFKNRLIFQIDVQWVPPLLGMNANVLDLFLCTVTVLRVPYIVCYVLGFSPVCLTPQTTALNEQVSRDGFCHSYFCTLFGIEWTIFMEMARYIWSLAYLKTTNKVYKLLYNLVNIGVVDAEHLLLLKNRCLSHLPYSQKNLSYFPHMVCLPQPIQLGAVVVNCCIGTVIK